jgi:P27 family predicted phage terminase small subunit
MVTEHPANSLQAIPSAPDTLSEGARLEWQQLAPVIFALKTARPADLRALELLCEILADIRAIEETVRSEGYTVISSGGPKPHPALRTLDSNRRQAQALMDKFRLLPNGRQVSDYNR